MALMESQGAFTLAVQFRLPEPLFPMYTLAVCAAVVLAGRCQLTWEGPAVRVGPGRLRSSSTFTVIETLAESPWLFWAVRVMVLAPTGSESVESSAPVPVFHLQHGRGGKPARRSKLAAHGIGRLLGQPGKDHPYFGIPVPSALCLADGALGKRHTRRRSAGRDGEE